MQDNPTRVLVFRKPSGLAIAEVFCRDALHRQEFGIDGSYCNLGIEN
ncbi:MAG: hypothetical protein HC929_10590 [Leptolyngbyaceae cyanobacterium SM2_5_2]|nr:hypothetical protein [Leptolyngbyaceae cyanobacterium SM2_5_2]